MQTAAVLVWAARERNQPDQRKWGNRKNAQHRRFSHNRRRHQRVNRECREAEQQAQGELEGAFLEDAFGNVELVEFDDLSRPRANALAAADDLFDHRSLALLLSKSVFPSHTTHAVTE